MSEEHKVQEELTTQNGAAAEEVVESATEDNALELAQEEIADLKDYLAGRGVPVRR